VQIDISSLKGMSSFGFISQAIMKYTYIILNHEIHLYVSCIWMTLQYNLAMGRPMTPFPTWQSHSPEQYNSSLPQVKTFFYLIIIVIQLICSLPLFMNTNKTFLSSMIKHDWT
jgi:hypothetical protein